MNGRPDVIVQVSSAKQLVGQDELDVTELMKRIKSVGLRGEPWGTPAVGEPGSERDSPTCTCCVRSVRKSDSHSRAELDTPGEKSFLMRARCQFFPSNLTTLRKAYICLWMMFSNFGVIHGHRQFLTHALVVTTGATCKSPSQALPKTFLSNLPPFPRSLQDGHCL